MTVGPIQLVVLGFEEPDRFQGRILAELEEVRGRDVVRLLDLLFVSKDEEERAGDGQAPDDTVPEGTAAGLIDPAVVQAAADAEPSANDAREA